MRFPNILAGIALFSAAIVAIKNDDHPRTFEREPPFDSIRFFTAVEDASTLNGPALSTIRADAERIEDLLKNFHPDDSWSIKKRVSLFVEKVLLEGAVQCESELRNAYHGITEAIKPYTETAAEVAKRVAAGKFSKEEVQMVSAAVMVVHLLELEAGRAKDKVVKGIRKAERVGDMKSFAEGYKDTVKGIRENLMVVGKSLMPFTERFTKGAWSAAAARKMKAIKEKKKGLL